MPAIRTIAVLAGAALVGLLSVRAAIVDRSLKGTGALAQLVWPGHPAVILPWKMGEVGRLSAAGQPVAPSLIASMIETSRRAPLAPEPFLVRGVQAQLAGDEARAGDAFRAAIWRSPRSIAGHFFLASHYSRAGNPVRATAEMGTLTRLTPSISGLPERIAQLASAKGGPDQIRSLLKANPALRTPVLAALANDIRNADLVVAIAIEQPSSDDQGWQFQLVNALVVAGEYDRAYAMWARFNGEQADRSRKPLLNSPSFVAPKPAPFDWTFGQGAGLVEPAPGGGIHLIYYGRENLTAATQLLLLEPGSYQLSYRVSSSARTDPIRWQMICLPAGVPAARAPLHRGSMDLEVAPSCRAQRLELVAAPPELPGTVEATITKLDLKRLGR